jgi:hypothetical protein
MAYLLQGPSTTENKTTTHRTHRTHRVNAPRIERIECCVTAAGGDYVADWKPERLSRITVGSPLCLIIRVSSHVSLIGSAIRKWNLAFCHEAASRVTLSHAATGGDPPASCLVMLVRHWPRCTFSEGPPIAENKSTTHRTQRACRAIQPSLRLTNWVYTMWAENVTVHVTIYPDPQSVSASEEPLPKATAC